MHSTDVARAAGSITAAIVPAIVPAAIPAWGPPIIELFGVNIPIASMTLSLLGLAMARGVSSARESKKQPGGWYLTGTLTLILIGIVLERQPGPGMAVAWGVGIGASGILLVDLLKDWVLGKAQILFGKEPKP